MFLLFKQSAITMRFLCLLHFVFACSSIQTKLCLFLLVLMTHASEDLLDPGVDIAQTVPIAAETDNENGISDVDQWGNDQSSPLPSEKTEEKIVTVVKKVTLH